MVERNLPPEEFNEYLRYLGGVNRYDENMFRVAWAQTETFIAGGTWSVDEASFTGYRSLLKGSGEACWMLLQWHAAEEYGSPEGYYVTNYDEESGLQILGEYPYSGRYEVLYHLRWNELIDNKLTLHSFPLATWMLDMIVPIVIAAKDVSIEKRKAAYLDAKQRAENEKIVEIERHLHDKHLPFSEQVSFSRQGIRSTVIDQKMVEMQREWSNLQNAARKFRLGLQTK